MFSNAKDYHIHFRPIGLVMTEANRVSLTPRQEECLRLVWERRATSKEIALDLGISKKTVDLHLAQAVAALGAADRRDAARLAFGPIPTPSTINPQLFRPGIVSHEDASPISPAPDPGPPAAPSMKAAPPDRPWGSEERPLNTMTTGQTLRWGVMIAVLSLLALTLATIIGSGVASLGPPVLQTFDRLTH